MLLVEGAMDVTLPLSTDKPTGEASIDRRPLAASLKLDWMRVASSNFGEVPDVFCSASW
ncbi:hypothetical protein D3C87_1361890 [compost metagenome]